MHTFHLPDLGEGLHEAEIVSWHVSAGDHVVTDQPLVAVETDKAVVEIPSPQSGRIAKVFGQTGERLQVGAPLVEFETGAAADTGAIVGEISAVPAVDLPAPIAARAGGRAAPAARALARKLGVDLALISGTGPDGAVTSADVERAAASLADTLPPEPLRGVLRTMAQRMARARSEVVPATVSDQADVHAWPAGTVIMLRLIRAVVAGCQTAPALNAWFDGETMSRRLHRKIDLGIAVDIEEGLFVPVLRDVANRSVDDLHGGLERLKGDVRARTIPPQELRGQTITLSNFGSVGGRYAQLVVVPPQVAILGVGRAIPHLVMENGQPVEHRMLPLSLTFDHRAVTGAEAARFLLAAIRDLEKAV